MPCRGYGGKGNIVYMLEDVIKSYGGTEVSAMDVYIDMFKLGDGWIQRENEEP